MAYSLSTRTINAPVASVFAAVSQTANFAEAVPGIVKIEHLSETRSGVGTRFRETRLMKGREATTELEVTEFSENESIRLVSDTHGAVWDSVFTVEPQGQATLLTLKMDARPHTLMARIMTPMLRPMVRKALDMDMDAIKAWCEK